MKKIKELYLKLTDNKKWVEVQFEKCLYSKKKNYIKQEIDKASKESDWQKIQELNFELFWLAKILEYDYKNEVIEIRKKEDFVKWSKKMLIEFYIGLDEKAITNKICLGYLQKDLIAPKKFESNNRKHIFFTEEITGKFEEMSREIRFEHKTKKTSDLFINKNIFYEALTFYSNFADKTCGSDYVFELRDLLKEIN